MSKLRSLCVMFSLAFMLLGGVFTPAPVSASSPQRGIVVPIMDQEHRSSIVWTPTSAEAAEFIKMAEDMGAKVSDASSSRSKDGDVLRLSNSVTAVELMDILNDNNGDAQKIKITITFRPLTITIEF